MARHDGSSTRRHAWASALNALAGIWLVVSAFLLGFAPDSRAVWNAVIVGVLIGLIAACRMVAGHRLAWLGWINVLLGAWTMASPWIFRYTDVVDALWNSVVIGGLVMILSCLGLSASESARPRSLSFSETDDDVAGYPLRPGWEQPHHAPAERAAEVPAWYAPGRPAAVYAEGEHRGKGPRAYRRTDSDVLAVICEHMTDDPTLDATDIEVRVRDAVVTLDGTVPTRRARRRAEEICDSVSGVRDIVNGLQVTGPAAGRGGRRVA